MICHGDDLCQWVISVRNDPYPLCRWHTQEARKKAEAALRRKSAEAIYAAWCGMMPQEGTNVTAKIGDRGIDVGWL